MKAQGRRRPPVPEVWAYLPCAKEEKAPAPRDRKDRVTSANYASCKAGLLMTPDSVPLQAANCGIPILAFTTQIPLEALVRVRFVPPSFHLTIFRPIPVPPACRAT